MRRNMESKSRRFSCGFCDREVGVTIFVSKTSAEVSHTMKPERGAGAESSL